MLSKFLMVTLYIFCGNSFQQPAPSQPRLWSCAMLGSCIPTRTNAKHEIPEPRLTRGHPRLQVPKADFFGWFPQFFERWNMWDLWNGSCSWSWMLLSLSLSFCFVIFVHLDVGAAPISCVYFFSNILCHFQRRLMVWAFAISLQWTPPHVQTFLTKSTSDLCRVAGYFSGDNFHQRDSSNHMEVSWNRGTPKSSIFVWDFTL